MAATPSPMFFRKSTLACEATKETHTHTQHGLVNLLTVQTTTPFPVTTEFQTQTRGGAALGSSWRLLGFLTGALAHILSLVLVPHTASHPLHPLSPRKPLQQKGPKYSPKRSTTTTTSPDAPHLLQRVPDGQQSVLRVRPPSLAGRAKIVVWTNGTLEASSNHGSLTAIAGDIRVQDLSRGHWGGQGMMSSRWGRRKRVAKAKWRESMKRKVSAVLLLLWKRSGKQTKLFLLPGSTSTLCCSTFAFFFFFN